MIMNYTVTKDHIKMYTIAIIFKFKTALFFGTYLSGITVLSNTTLFTNIYL